MALKEIEKKQMKKDNREELVKIEIARTMIDVCKLDMSIYCMTLSLPECSMFFHASYDL